MATDETKILYLLLGYGIATAIFIGNFFISSFRQKKLNRHLHTEKTAVEIATMERERKRIANDLHDDVAPQVAAIKMRVEALEPRTVLQVREMRKMKRQLNGVLKKLREASNDLMPAELAEGGLYDAMQSFRDNVESSGKLKIQLLFSEDIPLSQEQELHLYRIFCEAVHNCLKHANATIFSWHICSKSKRVAIEMKDDGKGFHFPANETRIHGLGLSSIANRVELLRGDFAINTKPGKGTRLFITIPTKPANHGREDNTGDS